MNKILYYLIGLAIILAFVVFVPLSHADVIYERVPSCNLFTDDVTINISGLPLGTLTCRVSIYGDNGQDGATKDCSDGTYTETFDLAEGDYDDVVYRIITPVDSGDQHLEYNGGTHIFTIDGSTHCPTPTPTPDLWDVLGSNSYSTQDIATIGNFIFYGITVFLLTFFGIIFYFRTRVKSL